MSEKRLMSFFPTRHGLPKPKRQCGLKGKRQVILNNEQHILPNSKYFDIIKVYNKSDCKYSWW